ncbi:SPFH domain-containing protein [Roseivirga sp.]|uniref:SPFH domain-containing protein n=1 Tax=Roseivirga sp. TaxID=1964215 RepID=UPI003B5259FD
MLGYNYTKFNSSQYVFLFKNGRIRKEGKGLSFWYFAPSSSISVVPLSSSDCHFMFQETTLDYQEVTLQGQVTYKVNSPKKVIDNLNLSVNTKGQYLSNDFEKLEQRIIGQLQSSASSILKRLELKLALTKLTDIESQLFEMVLQSSLYDQLGIEVLTINLVGIKPTPEMARALEAHKREELQKDADKAIYERRNFSVEQERMIKESELKTEIAIEEKQRQIAEKKLETEVVKQENVRRIKEMEIETQVSVQEKTRNYIDLKVQNERKEADLKGYVLNASIKPLKELDWRVLMAINGTKTDPKMQMAIGFRELAENATKIGNLNISPDLISSILSTKSR